MVKMFLIYDPQKELYLRYTPSDTCEGDWHEWVKLDDYPTHWCQNDAEVHWDTLHGNENLRIVPVTLTPVLEESYQPED